MSFYTNVQCFSGDILYRGFTTKGKRVKLYLPSKRPTEYKSLDGQFLQQKIFGNICEARDYIKQFNGVSGSYKIYGNTNYEYAYIADQHVSDVQWEYDKILNAVVDIEVGSENGFPDPYLAVNIQSTWDIVS